MEYLKQNETEFTEIVKGYSAEEKVQEWRYIVDELTTLKQNERILRLQIIEENFDTSIVGSRKVELDDGCKIKATIKETTTVSGDEEEITDVIKNIGSNLAPFLFNKKYSLSKTHYNLLSRDDQIQLRDVLVTKPATPTLEVVLPKQKGK